MRVVLTRLPKDTLRFETPARAYRCAGPRGHIGGGLLLQGVSGGNGVVVWLRTPDSIASGAWPVLQRGDTLSPRGATVGVRFMLGDAAHGAPLDSGTVWVTRADNAVALAARGSGSETFTSAHTAVEVRIDAVPVGADTVSCRSQL
ncbi:MAG: hypothetical protein AUF61_00270 [Chloroflexi bacterium 13_1_20CM_66_33]|nr:MAG: hypothetical protein AUF61_00270 [Chloroflexi bacterium 13_1_20CM_66_33]